MSLQFDLFTEFLVQAPFQPATDLWRAIEISVVIEAGLPRGRGLDLGCGDGKLTQILGARSGAREWIGVDIDATETSLAERSGFYRRVHTGSGAAVPEPTASFDLVFSNSVLEHIPDVDAVLAEVARLLKAGGVFVFTVPGPGFHACLRGPRRGDRTRYLRAIDERCAHLRYWDVETWTRQLARQGLRVTRVVPYLDVRQTRRWETLSNLTAGMLHAFFRGRRRPIEIQRALGMRRAPIRLPRSLARSVASVLARGTGTAPAARTGLDNSACILVWAERDERNAGHETGTQAR